MQYNRCVSAFSEQYHNASILCVLLIGHRVSPAAHVSFMLQEQYCRWTNSAFWITPSPLAESEGVEPSSDFSGLALAVQPITVLATLHFLQYSYESHSLICRMQHSSRKIVTRGYCKSRNSAPFGFYEIVRSIYSSCIAFP